MHPNRERFVVALARLVDRVVAHVDVELVLDVPQFAGERCSGLSGLVFLAKDESVFRQSKLKSFCFLCFTRHSRKFAGRDIVHFRVSLILASDGQRSNQLVLEGLDVKFAI